MKSIVKGVAAALSAAALSASVVSAQVNIVGSTAGCFAASYSGGCATSISQNGATLTYTGSTINTLATGSPIAVASLGGDPADGVVVNVNNLGSFRLDLSGQGIGGSTFSSPFTLQVSVTAPQVGAGTTTGLVTTATGTISVSGGTLFVTFADFANGSAVNTANYKLIPGTQVSYFVNDAAIGAPRTGDVVRNVSLTGAIAAPAVVPEPSTYMLLATGMGALGLIARRRRNNV